MQIDKIVSGGRGERSWRSGDPSSEGVQRDLLPIIEVRRNMGAGGRLCKYPGAGYGWRCWGDCCGSIFLPHLRCVEVSCYECRPLATRFRHSQGSVVSTKHGNVNTDHILFICAGAFHSVKPSDLMAELQVRTAADHMD